VTSEIPAPDRVVAGEPRTGARALVDLLLKPLAFVGISGVGWLIDLGTFLVLTEGVGWAGSVSNIVSSALGIVFVFAASHGHLFGGNAEDRGAHFTAYVLYQVLLVGGVSLAIDAIVDATGVLPIVAKLVLTPVTISINYVVLSRIARWSPSSRRS